MAIDIKKIKDLMRIGRDGSNELDSAKERSEKLKNQLKKQDEKIGKKIDPVSLQEIDVVTPPTRDRDGRIILKKDPFKGGNRESSNQYIAVKLNTPDYDTSEFETVLNNTVTELLPKLPPQEKELTIPERIDKFFIEFEFLRDHIWSLKGEDSTKSHVYLEKESDSYLPKRDVNKEYIGDNVGEAGRVKLVSGNKMKARDAVFLDTMVGAKVTAYGIEPQKDSVLEVEHILKTVQSRMFKLNSNDKQDLNDIDVVRFIKHLKRSLLSKYETEQVRRSEIKDLSELIKESINKFYPDQRELVRRIEIRKEEEKKAGVAEKMQLKKKELRRVTREMKKSRKNRKRRYMGGRLKFKKTRKVQDPNNRSSSRKRNA